MPPSLKRLGKQPIQTTLPFAGPRKTIETKKCTGKCKKVLPCDDFGVRNINAVGAPVFFTTCLTCRAKDSANRAKQKQKVPAGHRLCQFCKGVLLIAEFDVKQTKDGVETLYSTCRECIPKTREKTKQNVAAKKQNVPEGHHLCTHCTKIVPVIGFGTWTSAGKEIRYQACKDCQPKQAAYGAEYEKTDECKSRRKRWRQSAAGIVSTRRRNHNEAGLARRKKYKETDTYRHNSKRSVEHRRVRYHFDERYRMQCLTLSSARRLIIGECEQSHAFEQRTGWVSSNFTSHMRNEVAKYNALHETNHVLGDVDIEQEHKIPCNAFDFTNPDDVRRCWSASNVHVMTRADNNAKDNKILDEYVNQVDVDAYPLSWNGVVPTQSEREALYAQWHASAHVTEEQMLAFREFMAAKKAAKASNKSAKAIAKLVELAKQKMLSIGGNVSEDSDDESSDEEESSDDESSNDESSSDDDESHVEDAGEVPDSDSDDEA